MKAEIVSIFIQKPEIVYLDEPTIGLDVATKQKVTDFLDIQVLMMAWMSTLG